MMENEYYNEISKFINWKPKYKIKNSLRLTIGNKKDNIFFLREIDRIFKNV